MDEKREPTNHDYAEEAESAQRGSTRPQAAALWRRAAQTAPDAAQAARYERQARRCGPAGDRPA